MKEFKVAKLMDDDIQLVINGGKKDGVKINDKFMVYELGENVIDPDTKEDLGRLEIVKGIGKVTHVQDMISTIRSVKVKKAAEKRIVYQRNPYSNSLVDLFGRFKNEEIIKEGDDVILPFISPKVGDLVKYLP